MGFSLSLYDFPPVSKSISRLQIEFSDVHAPEYQQLTGWHRAD